MRVLLYDAEIKCPIADKKLIKPEPNIVYANGWTDYLGMGIAIVTAFDYHTNLPRIFCEDNLSEFAALVDDADVMVGFNSVRFDNPLMRAHGIDLPEDRCYDMFTEIKEAAGVTNKYAKGYNLDNCCRVNLGEQKAGDGAMFPILWQRGQLGQCFDYALRDITLEARMLDLMWSQPILDPGNPGQRIIVRNPTE